MKKLILSAALFMGLATLSFAGTPKGETKSPNTEGAKVEATATSSVSNSTSETQDFYVDNAGNRLDDIYPTLGDCMASETENCHATYTRVDSSSPWVLQGQIQKGIKP